ncbi:MAG: mucoidy inhibitor MuiA family protein, partial [Deltaproteobacteria bacterium]|nr:mucoidy inhibitor MuiA family protein [Deltaproteobacteria bacterium]
MSQLIELTSKITSVEVYRSQALVTRQATVELGDKTGSLDLRLTQLPFLLRDDSVRVDLMGQSGVRIVDVHLELELGKREGDIRTPAEDQLTNLLRERLELYIKKQQQIDQLRFFSSLTPAEHDEIDLPRDIAFSERHQSGAWLELSDYVRSQMEKHYQAIRQVAREIRTLNDQIVEAQNELAAESQAEVAALAICRKAARLQLELENPVAALVLEFSYMVPAARWVPDYELRVDAEQDRAELVLKALVAQRTGEEWTLIDLAFSTADLKRSTKLPELDSWRIGKAQPPKPSGWKELPDTISELFEGYDRDLRSLPAPQIPDSIELPRSKRLGSEGKEDRKGKKKRKEMLRNQVKEFAKMQPPPAPPQQAPQAVMEPCEDFEDDEYDMDEMRCEEQGEFESAIAVDCLS